ncbi:MAG: hypothetical protein O7D91_17480 [Planctomycetota bacterium]|nr:hypothetical protein [Planctomycetota bacterium]
MPRDNQARIGRPFHGAVRESQLNEVFTQIGHLKSISVAHPLTLTHTAGGGYRFGIQLPKPVKAAAATAVATVRYAHIKSVDETNKQQVMIQFVTSTKTVTGTEDDPITTITWAKVGDPRIAIVPPNFTSADFKELARDVFNVATPVVRVDKHGSDLIIVLEPRWVIRKLPTSATITRCT